MRLSLLVPCSCLLLAALPLGRRAAEPPAIEANDNRTPAGILAGGTLELRLVAQPGRWHPEAGEGPGILVAALGRPELIRGDWIRPGAAVIDVGINRVAGAHDTSRLVGDVAYGEAAQVAGAITPVPGGVGPMTVACLLRNTLVAARAQAR